MRLTGGLSTSETPERPSGEAGNQPGDDCERGQGQLGPAGDQPAPGLEESREWIHRCDTVDPALEQVERDIHRREEEHKEDRHLHDGRRLLGAQTHRNAGRPQRPGHVQQEAKRIEADEVDAAAADLHAREQRHDCDDCGDRDPPKKGREREAENDAAAVRRREHESPHEAALEVPRDPEAGEDPGECCGLEQNEDELERRVPVREVEAGDLLDAREPAREGREEEEWEHQRREKDRRVRKGVVERPPGDRARDGERLGHVRSNLRTRAWVARANPSRLRPPPTANPSPIASQFHPSITSARTDSIRYETGFALAAHLNQSVSIRLRGMFIDEMNRKTKKTGKSPWTTSVDPLRSAAHVPMPAKPSAITSSSRSRSAAPPMPLSRRTPNARPTAR